MKIHIKQRNKYIKNEEVRQDTLGRFKHGGGVVVLLILVSNKENFRVQNLISEGIGRK